MSSLECLDSSISGCSTPPFFFFFLLSLNAGISKDAGPDRLMACLEQSKTQPASLSLSGTGAKTKSFPSPKEPCKHVRSGFSYFTGSVTVDASLLGNISCICTLVFDDTKKQKFNFAFSRHEEKAEFCHLGKIQHFLS